MFSQQLSFGVPAWDSTLFQCPIAAFNILNRAFWPTMSIHFFDYFSVATSLVRNDSHQLVTVNHIAGLPHKTTCCICISPRGQLIINATEPRSLKRSKASQFWPIQYYGDLSRAIHLCEHEPEADLEFQHEYRTKFRFPARL